MFKFFSSQKCSQFVTDTRSVSILHFKIRSSEIQADMNTFKKVRDILNLSLKQKKRTIKKLEEEYSSLYFNELSESTANFKSEHYDKRIWKVNRFYNILRSKPRININQLSLKTKLPYNKCKLLKKQFEKGRINLKIYKEIIEGK